MISFTRSCVTASLFAHVTKSLITRRSDWAVGGAGLAGLGLGGGAVAAFEAGPEPNRPDPNGDFADTAVLITGVTSGIGHATAIAFANRGAKVFFCGRRNELGLANQDQIRLMGGDATFHRADVREEGQVRDFFVAACVDRYGRIDVAFNNAGVETPGAALIHEQSVEDWNNVQRTNTRGVFLSMKHELPHMLAAGRGVIINNSSVSAEVGFPTISPVQRQQAWHRLTDQGRRARVRRQEHPGQRGGARAQSTPRCCAARPPRSE